MCGTLAAMQYVHLVFLSLALCGAAVGLMLFSVALLILIFGFLRYEWVRIAPMGWVILVGFGLFTLAACALRW